MKTIEFKHKVEKLGYNFDIDSENILITDTMVIHVRVSTHEYNKIRIETSDIKLIEICMEYAKTPMDQREDNEYEDEESIRIERFYNCIGERRYRIIRLETGEIHEGNGWGYKSVDSALKAYSYIRKYLS